MIALLQGVINGLLKLHLDVARHFAHPENHPCQDHHGDDRDDALKQLLLFLRKLAGGFIDDDTEREAERGGEKNADPHHTNPAAALGTLEVAGDEANDQRRFETFA